MNYLRDVGTIIEDEPRKLRDDALGVEAKSVSSYNSPGMFTSGQTPVRTPRRTGRSSAQPTTPLVQTQQLPSTAATPATAGLRRTSRFNDSPAAAPRTPRRAMAIIDQAEEEIKRENIVGDKLLVRDASYAVLERRGLPIELDQVITVADPYTDPLRAVLDSLTGFALLVTRDYCLVWNWSRRSSSSTTYAFPLPPILSMPALASAFSPLSFAAFAPALSLPSQREPGLLIATPRGDIRYWENVSMALSGVDRWKGGQAKLDEGELIRGITLHNATTFLLSTTNSRILLVTISSIGGRMEVALRPFDRAVGWAGSVWKFLGGKASDPRSGILAIAISSTSSVGGESIAYAVADRTVQVWKLPGRDDEGGERMLIEQDLFAGVLEGLMGQKPTNEIWALNEAKVEILDAQVESSGNLVVLASHIASSTLANSLSYAIVTLSVGTTQNSVTVVSTRYVSYQARPDPRPLSSPKLSLSGGETAFVIFVDAVVMMSLARGATFEETFPLRSSTNRFLGMSTSLPLSAAIPTFSLLTSTASIISIEITAPSGLTSDSKSSVESKTKKLKTKIEQAIFFGSDAAENPLAFDLLPDFEGDLITAAEAVSAEILSSSSANMPSIIDLRAQLADRSLRSRALIQYINSNGLLGKLSQRSRRHLSWDSERLAAAASLWQHQNARLSERQQGDTVLASAIGSYMFDIGEAYGEDVVRTFFRTRVSSIGSIVEHVTKFAKSSLAASSDSAVRSTSLHEANALILLVFKSIIRHRAESSTFYGIDSHSLPVEAWSSRSVILDALQWHFEATTALLAERSRDFGKEEYGGRARAGPNDAANQSVLQTDLKHQMSELAKFVFSMFEERLLFLSTVTADGPTSAESRTISERYLTLRPKVISTLVSIDHVKAAYELAERHRDFRSLVELCNDPQHGSTSRIRVLLEKYGEEFAFALYHFYVEQGQLKTLMEQDEIYRPFLTKFLDSTSNSRIDWINDIIINRFDHATESLVEVAATEKGLAEKKLMLSLAKLTQVAQASHEDIRSERVQRAIELIDDNLDLVNSQKSLAITLSQGSLIESRQSIETQANLITSRVAPNLGNRPAFAQLYSEFTARLLRNETVSAEDTIDLLTLKENNQSNETDYAAALDILVRAKNIPRARHAIALQNIWRRVYLRDDWETLRSPPGLTDDQIALNLRGTALFSTLSAAEGADLPNELYLSPEQSLFIDTNEEIAARFPHLSAEFIDALIVDLELESDLIREAIEHHGLNSYCDEIARLLKEGGPSESEQPMDGEDSMMQ